MQYSAGTSRGAATCACSHPLAQSARVDSTEPTMTMRRLFLILCAAAHFSTGSAAAQSNKDFSTVRYYPSVGVGNYIGLDGAQVGGHRHSSYGAFLDYSQSTLKVDDPCD